MKDVHLNNIKPLADPRGTEQNRRPDANRQPEAQRGAFDQQLSSTVADLQHLSSRVQGAEAGKTASGDRAETIKEELTEQQKLFEEMMRKRQDLDQLYRRIQQDKPQKA